ncbi:hypothetical protein K432DRAFT_439142 [Lepidopterella palustris CBS 459.81]|uniref:Uncharacterized protein n=1 Tax=Lepidopterella palustris CBS 459.81 TaxID=1314670 RepID=A0A8E2EKS4_9PEZI|nr:hypothetical protein K432DRAFT_439142 [Lepidopterella palustris CBS 459.81]
MPEFKGLTVKVTTQADQEFDEYGINRWPDTCSAYIQSETGVSFKISLTPDVKYFAGLLGDEPLRPDAFKERAKKPSTHNRRSDYYSRPYADTALKDESMDEDSDRENIRPVTSAHTTRYAYYYKDPNPKPKSEVALLASLYLDGRSKNERRTIIYLDPTHHHFNEPAGTVCLTSRWVLAKDGSMMAHKWLFKDVGIETLFDKMMLSGDIKSDFATNKDAEDALIDAIGSLGTQDHDLPEAKAGTIKIVLQRVKIGREYDDEKYRPDYTEGETGDVDMDGADKVTHTTGIDSGHNLGKKIVAVITYQPIEEPIYATFVFFYRSKEVLRKFGFEGFPQSPFLAPVVGPRGRLNDAMINITPLGISNPLPPKEAPDDCHQADEKSSEQKYVDEKLSDNKSRDITPTSSTKPSFTTFRDNKKTDTPKGKRKEKSISPTIRSVSGNSQRSNTRTFRAASRNEFDRASSQSESESGNPMSGSTSSSSTIQQSIQPLMITAKSPAAKSTALLLLGVEDNVGLSNTKAAPWSNKLPHQDLVYSSSADTLSGLVSKSSHFSTMRHTTSRDMSDNEADDEREASSSEVEHLHHSIVHRSTSSLFPGLISFNADESNGISANLPDEGLGDCMEVVLRLDEQSQTPNQTQGQTHNQLQNYKIGSKRHRDEDEKDEESEKSLKWLDMTALHRIKKFRNDSAGRDSESVSSGYIGGDEKGEKSLIMFDSEQSAEGSGAGAGAGADAVKSADEASLVLAAAERQAIETNIEKEGVAATGEHMGADQHMAMVPGIHVTAPSSDAGKELDTEPPMGA